VKLRTSLHEFVPPIIWRAFHESTNAEQVLFDGDDGLFRELLDDAAIYGEYGVGLSTVVAYRESECAIQSVDTSQTWIEQVIEDCETRHDNARMSIEWVDLGPLGDWGRPLTYAQMEDFGKYTGAIWRPQSTPDLILIDGRFRTACFFQALLLSPPKTRILFDDYVDRPHYHVVERVLSPTTSYGRQALFVVPDAVDSTEIRRLYEQFLMVLD